MAEVRQPGKLKVFISYSRRDLAFVDSMQAALNARDIDAAVDRTEIAKGEAWWKRIEQLITEADAVVFVLSPASAGSQICQQEVDFAETLKKRIVPIVAEDVTGLKVPDALARLNYVFFIPNALAAATGDFDLALDELLRALETDIPWVREHTRIGGLAQRWHDQGAGKARDLLLRGAELDAAERWMATRPAKAPDVSDAHIAFLAESRRAATRRQRWIAGISTAAAVVAIALAGLAYFQSVEASKQRATTVKISNEAQSTESGLLSEAARVISDQPGGGDAPLAMLLALEGMPDTASYDMRQVGRPFVAEAQLQLDRALRANRERRFVARASKIAWSPDGHLLATALWDNTTADGQVFDVETGMEVARYASGGSVRTLAWSPGGTLLATGSSDGTVRIFQARTGKEIARIACSGPVNTVAWSPNGNYLATGSADANMRIVEAATGTEITNLQGFREVNVVAWSPDGQLLAVGTGQQMQGEAHIYEPMSGKARALVLHESPVLAVAWSPDGTKLATGPNGPGGRIIDATTGAEIARIEYGGSAVAWGSNGQLATAGKDGVKIVTERGFEITSIPHDGRVNDVAWSPDARLLAIGSGDVMENKGDVRVVEQATGREMARVSHNGAVNAVAWSSAGFLATVSSDNTARILDTAPGREVFLKGAAVHAVAWSPDGQMAVVAGGYEKGEARIVDAATRTEIARAVHGGPVRAVAWSPNGEKLVTGSNDKVARIIDAKTGGEIIRVAHGGPVRAVAWSPDGEKLATGSDDKFARIIDAQTGKEIARIENGNSVPHVVWGPDGRLLLIRSSDGTARIIEAASGRELARVADGVAVESAAWSPDGRLLAAATCNGTACEVWVVEATNGKRIDRIGPLFRINAVAWSPDGRSLAIGLHDKTLLIFDSKAGRQLVRGVYDETVRAVSWSPNGQLLAITMRDHAARIVEAATGKEIARLAHDRDLYSLAWSPDGAASDPAIVTGSVDGIARFWSLFPTPQSLVDAAKVRASRCLTQSQRAKYFLPPAPPLWCVERRLWPYHGDDWQAWLPKQRAWVAGARQGEEPPLPKPE